MKLTYMPVAGKLAKIIPATANRAWLASAPATFASPLYAANENGWLVLNGAPLVAEWNGGIKRDSIMLQPTEMENAYTPAVSEAGHGVISFQIAATFGLMPGFDLWVMGPPNHIKDGIQPLTTIVRGDGAMSLAAHWRFTRKRCPVAFELDEPICFFFPVQRGLVQSITPESAAP